MTPITTISSIKDTPDVRQRVQVDMRISFPALRALCLDSVMQNAHGRGLPPRGAEERGDRQPYGRKQVRCDNHAVVHKNRAR